MFFTCSTAKSHKGKICQKYRTLDSLSQYQSVSCRASIILLVHALFPTRVDVAGGSVTGLPWLRRVLMECAFHEARGRDRRNRRDNPHAEHRRKLFAFLRYMVCLPILMARKTWSHTLRCYVLLLLGMNFCLFSWVSRGHLRLP